MGRRSAAGESRPKMEMRRRATELQSVVLIGGKFNLLTIWLSAQCLPLRSNLSPHLHRRLVCRAATGATSPAKGYNEKRGRLSSSSFRTQSRGRTGTGVNLLVFETSASTDSAIWASGFTDFERKDRDYFLFCKIFTNFFFEKSHYSLPNMCRWRVVG